MKIKDKGLKELLVLNCPKFDFQCIQAHMYRANRKFVNFSLHTSHKKITLKKCENFIWYLKTKKRKQSIEFLNDFSIQRTLEQKKKEWIECKTMTK